MLFDSMKISRIWKVLTIQMIPLITVANSPTHAFETHQLSGKHLHVIWVGCSLSFPYYCIRRSKKDIQQ